MPPRYVESLNRALHGLMAADPRVVLIGEDILDPYGGAFKASRGLSSAFPLQVLPMPISEAGLTGFATGMAMRGFRPVVEIMFGDFVTLITDQIVNHAAKFRWMYGDRVRVPLVIRTPMGGRRGYGPTHSQTLESLFLGVPGLRIAAPSHAHDPGAMLAHVVTAGEDPILFIENKLLYPQRLLVPDAQGKAGGFHLETVAGGNPAFPTLRLSLYPGETPDATLIAYGGMAPLAMEAVRSLFLEEEILADLLLPSLVKPVPVSDFLVSARRSGRVAVAEEGPVSGGWGAEVASLIQELAHGNLRAPIRRVGAPDHPIPSSRPMEEGVLPQVADIAAALRGLVRR
jgi:pyruvate/2-oxoglutarate/acetoin dehydrogenase E1 component